MPHYKSPDNAVHFLDSADFEYLLPVGSIQITVEEAEALRPSHKPVIVEEVTPIEKLQTFLQSNPDVAALL